MSCRHTVKVLIKCWCENTWGQIWVCTQAVKVNSKAMTGRGRVGWMRQREDWHKTDAMGMKKQQQEVY